MAAQDVESDFPKQGLNPHPLCWKHSLNHWTAREVLSLKHKIVGGEMNGESNMESYITICKIDSQGELAV